jgi:hypothetical protein
MEEARGFCKKNPLYGLSSLRPANVRVARRKRTESALPQAVSHSKKWLCRFFDSLEPLDTPVVVFILFSPDFLGFFSIILWISHLSNGQNFLYDTGVEKRRNIPIFERNVPWKRYARQKLSAP